MKKKNCILKFKVVIICTFVLITISCSKKDNNYTEQNVNNSKFVDTGTNSSQNNKIIESDSTILRTDNEGNILGGDMNDWNFEIKNYNEIQKDKYLFRRPFHVGDPIPVDVHRGDPNPLDNTEPFYYEIEGNDVILKWITGRETNNKGFFVEKAESLAGGAELKWISIGFVKGPGDSKEIRRYKFADNDLEKGTYIYRLKMISFRGESEYFNLSGQVVIMNYPEESEFYPAYPNPGTDTVNIAFYIEKKDVVNLFFLNGKDTNYILNHEPQVRGFYKLTIDKKELGFQNEIKRLYIDCKSCSKKKNFGDVQF